VPSTVAPNEAVVGNSTGCGDEMVLNTKVW
jgi:hypothetical protein